MKRHATTRHANTVIATDVEHGDTYVDVRCYVQGQRDWCRLRFTDELAERLVRQLGGTEA